MKKGAPVRSWKAAGSAASTSSTSKKRPKTAFMASSDSAVPPLRRSSSRRLSPRRGARRPASARIRCSTSFWAAVCGSGGNSSLETRRVGSGTSLASPRRMPRRTRKAWGFTGSSVEPDRAVSTTVVAGNDPLTLIWRQAGIRTSPARGGADDMKFYLFRCKARRQLLAASRYETGSNLPSDQCIGGWEFVEPLHLTGPKLPKHTVDVTKLRRAVQQNGLYVWEERSAPVTVASMTPPPPPMASVMELPPVPVPGADLSVVPIVVTPPPPERVLTP